MGTTTASRRWRLQEAASHPSVLFGWNVYLDLREVGHTVLLEKSEAPTALSVEGNANA